jgi:hypothetical protein
MPVLETSAKFRRTLRWFDPNHGKWDSKEVDSYIEAARIIDATGATQWHYEAVKDD